jgi:glycosidase
MKQFALTALLLSSLMMSAQVSGSEEDWWREVVFYEIFVRSFFDSDADGIGDFEGMIEKLDYLNDGDPDSDDDLGIGGIWLMPINESPSYHGYDVTDYWKTEPDFGTTEQLKAFIDSAHARGIKVIIDMVLNHSSSQHPWFIDARSNPASPYRSYYTFEPSNPGFNGPWGQPVWHNTGIGDYYYGLFWDGMPDLKFSDPVLTAEIHDVVRYWIDSVGVDGYRLDAIKYIYEDGTQLEHVDSTYIFLDELNAVYKAADPNAISVGEVWDSRWNILPYVGEDRIDFCFEFDLATSILNSLKNELGSSFRSSLADALDSYEPGRFAPFLTNHDQNRVLSELGSIPKAKIAAGLLLTLPGAPFIYYGEEIGMTGVGDHLNIRTPMQWNNSDYAGFSTVSPWRNPNGDYGIRNVEKMEADSSSLLHQYKKLIHLRNEHPELRTGETQIISAPVNALVSYSRETDSSFSLIVANLRGTDISSPKLSLASSLIPEGSYQLVDRLSGIGSTLDVGPDGSIVDWTPRETLPPYSFFVFQEGLPFASSIAEQDLIPLDIYPVPASDYLYVQMPEGMANSQVQVFDAAGNLVQQYNWNSERNEIDCSELISGMYFLEIRSDSKFARKTFQVNR